MKLVYLLFAIVLVSVLALAGCAQTSATQAGTTSSPTTSVSSPSTTPSTEPVTYTDDLGRSVQIKGIPQRIISLSPSNTEIVYALGMEDHLIGVTTYDNYPPAVTSIPQVSDYSTVDVEKIASLQPDLVLASDIQKTDAVPALQKLGIPVIVLDPTTIEGVYNDLELVGKIGGKTQAADALIASLQQRVKAVTDKVAQYETGKPRVLYITWHDPIWTAGKGTMIDDLLNKVGADNIAGDLNGYATMTLETAVARNPQIILVMSSMGDQTSLNYINSSPAFQATDALKNKQVYSIDSDIFGRTTPRIVDGLEQLARIIHPEAFK